MNMKIKYEFITGEVQEVIVPDELIKVVMEIERQVHNNNRNERRRHNSIEEMEEHGFQFKSNEIEVIENVEKILINESLYKALGKLSFDERKLIYLVFFQRKTIVSIAKERGVSEGNIRRILKLIYKEIRILLKNF
ncbi:MAG: sigma-70 family RNA polymerase sigma factor [Clostridium sulfidigenes]|uniref:Sigma-70 family RNA polymerase sigma factor n=1 Tax=Clostridium sulfidigenes TaxID=318464 RepID=A0A927ZUW1_9CLOT|nr:sigma-70 family RNA polymerase sigma factor [Clostridium sulfidigenes]